MDTAKLTLTQKPAHFNTLINLLVEQFKPLQIYLYAELKKQEICNSIFATSADEQDIYYLLMTTESGTRMENGIQDFLNAHYPEAKVIVQAHGQETIKKSLASSHIFFSKVLNRGVLLYSADGVLYSNQVEETNLQKQLQSARSHWHHRFEMAMGFMNSINTVIGDGYYNVCVFLMHQVVEQACIGLIWVFMGYKSDMHNLRRLLYICACFSKRPMQHFLAVPADADLLALMMKSYSAARYKEDFHIEEKDARRLLYLVEGFLSIAENMCAEKFLELETGLAQETEVNHD